MSRQQGKGGKDKLRQVTEILSRGDFPALVALTDTETGITTILVKLLFDPGSLLYWRAIEGLGVLAQSHPRKVTKIISRLLWLLNEESGSFGWGAGAALGEIGRNNLDLVEDIILIMFSLLEEEFARPGLLWGLGRLSQTHPEAVEPAADQIMALLEDPTAQVRANAAWCLGCLASVAAAPALRRLVDDPAGVAVYEEGVLRPATVGDIAREALARLPVT